MASEPPKVKAFPLQWPTGWPRTPTEQRQRGAYRTALPGALSNLRSELRQLVGKAAEVSLVLSSNVTLGNEHPVDSGVVAYFQLDGQQVAMPCDRWNGVEQNVQAIALTVQAMRAMERHGAKHMIKAMFQGFIALPPPPDWQEILDHPTTLAEAEAAYKRLAKAAHPDVGGGSQEAMAKLNAARKEAHKNLV